MYHRSWGGLIGPGPYNGNPYYEGGTKQMGLMKKLTSALVASSLVLSLVGSAFAAYTPGAGEEAGKRMQDLKIIQGRDGGDLALNSEITRAELVTTIVRAFGQEETAKYLVGSAIFPDTANHWASGNIAMAVKLVKDAGGDAIGMPDGTFAPDAKLTPAQAVAFLMKFVGVKRDATKAWPNDYLDPAVAAGLITAEDKALIAAETGNATRGLTFYLFDNAFYNYKLADGKTFYTKYVSPAGPSLTLTDLPETTMDSKVTVTGNAKGAYEVYVGSQKVTVDASGNFSAEFALPEVKAEPYTVTVTAVDRAGARVEKSDTIARVVGTIAAVEAAEITVAAGATVDVDAVAKDAAGNVVADAAITGESAVGTFADGKFTAAKVVGTGTLTLKAGEKTADVKVTIVAGPIAKVVADKAGAAPGEIVTLTAQDEHGNVISGATFSQTSSDAMLDGTTGKFMASKAGSYTVTATVGGASKDATVGIFGGFDSKSKVVVEAPLTIVGNNATEATVTLKVVDANGNIITNFDGTVALNDGNLDSAADVALKNGVATYTLTAPNATTGQIVTLTGSATKGGVTVTGTANVQVLQQVATSIKVDSPTYLTVNNTDGTMKTTASNVKVFVLDQDGKAMKTGAYAVKLSLTGPATFTQGQNVTSVTVNYTPNADTASGHDDDGAIATIFPTGLNNVGTVSFTGELSGLTVGTDSTTAAYAQNQASVAASVVTTAEKYVADVDANATKATFRGTLKDANGVPVAKDGINVTFDLDVDYSKVKIWQIDPATGLRMDSDAGTAGMQPLSADPVVTTTGGVANLSIESETFVGALNVTTKATDLASSSVSAQFVTGDPYYVTFNRSTMEVPQGTESVDLSAQIYDMAGNKVMKEGVKIVFTANNTDTFVNGGAKAEVKTDVNGVATVKVTTIGYVRTAPYNVTLEGDLSDLTHTSADRTNPLAPIFGTADLTAAITIDNTVAANVSIQTKVGNDPKFYVQTTETVRVLATVTDSRGNKLTGETVKLVLPKGANIVGGVLTTAETTYTMTELNAATDPGVYFWDVQFAKAPTTNFTVKVTTGLNDVVANGTIAVEAAAVNGVKVATDSNDKLLPTKGTVSGPYTISLVDAYGNSVFANSTTSTVKVSWTLSTAPNAANGEYFEIKASATGAALTGLVGGSTLDIPVGSNSVSFYVFTNIDTTVTFTGNTTGGTPGALAGTDAATVDAQ
jgi:hypothetical protein